MNMHNIFNRKNGKKGRKKLLAWILFLGMSILFLCKNQGENVFAASALTAPKGVLANGVNHNVVLSWEPVKGADGYEVFEKLQGQDSYQKIKVTAATKLVLSQKVRGMSYIYKIRAYHLISGKVKYGKFSKVCEVTLAEKNVSTLKNYLTVALKPVGSTMYIWGGGWNKADDGAGADALRIGLNPAWRTYAAKQTSSYNYRNTRYKRGYGLDCSGYVGWTVYNTLHTKKGKAGEGYVDKARNLARNYAGNGWGSYKKASLVKDYRAGDIMSSSGHVYIVIGECSDGSVVLVHSSPAVVQICGTVTPAGKRNSKAVRLAKTYMRKYFPSWYRKFPDCVRDSSYLTKYSQFRWNLSEGNILEDPDGYRNKSPKYILEDLLKNKV